ncbi:MAG: hypothetical protein N2440_01410 [Actinobacteria bacterium]|nr:hypothetical protein [Actinomycetota bacterium]
MVLKIDKSRIDFLCGYLFAKQKKLLSEHQLELLQSVKNFEELYSIITGTAFHHLVRDGGYDLSQIYVMEHGAGEEFRRLLKIEPTIIFLSVLNEVFEAMKLILLSEEKSKFSNRLFTCGFYGYELESPVCIDTNEGDVSCFLKMIKKEISGFESVFDLDLKVFKVKRLIRRIYADAIGGEMKDFLHKQEILEDVYLLTLLLFEERYLLENERQRDLISSLNAQFYDAFLEGERRQDKKVFFERISRIVPNLRKQIVQIIFASSPEEAEKAFNMVMERLISEYSLRTVSEIYPFIFVRRYMYQLKEIKRAYVSLMEKPVSGEAA